MHCTNCSVEISQNAEYCPKCGVKPFKIKNYCHNCGDQIHSNQDMCTGCGVLINKKTNYNENYSHSPLLILFLSFLVHGLGQIIVGQVKKGALIIIVCSFLAIITGGLTILISTPLAMIDGYKIASRKRKGEPIGEWDFF